MRRFPLVVLAVLFSASHIVTFTNVTWALATVTDDDEEQATPTSTPTLPPGHDDPSPEEKITCEAGCLVLAQEAFDRCIRSKGGNPSLPVGHPFNCGRINPETEQPYLDPICMAQVEGCRDVKNNEDENCIANCNKPRICWEPIIDEVVPTPEAEEPEDQAEPSEPEREIPPASPRPMPKTEID